MPILLVLFLVGACAPVAWSSPPFGWGARAAVTIMLVAIVLPVAGHYVLASWLQTQLRRMTPRTLLLERYSRRRRRLGLVHFALSIAAIVLGWGWVVQQRFTVQYDGHPTLAPYAELLVPLPFLVGVMLAWIIHFDAERALHRATAGEDAEFWSRPGHFLYRLRPFLFMVLIPALLVAGQQTLVRFAPDAASSEWARYSLVILAPALFLLMPLAAKPILGLRSLPPGHHRDRLEKTSRRLGFRCTDLLWWPTHHTVANAMVLGLLPRARYVVFTDRLLDSLDDDELDAVFGHEVGHVRHQHLLYYAAFFLLSMVVIFAGLTVLATEAQRLGWLVATSAPTPWLALPPLVIFAGYLFLVFGFLSRKCERQADLAGVATVAAGRSEGHPHAAGVYAMTRALEKVALLNGLENNYGLGPSTWRQRVRSAITAWTHGSIGARIDFLHRTLSDPELAARTGRRITWLRWLTLAALVAALVILGNWVGWRELASML